MFNLPWYVQDALRRRRQQSGLAPKPTSAAPQKAPTRPASKVPVAPTGRNRPPTPGPSMPLVPQRPRVPAAAPTPTPTLGAQPVAGVASLGVPLRMVDVPGRLIAGPSGGGGPVTPEEEEFRRVSSRVPRRIGNVPGRPPSFAWINDQVWEGITRLLIAGVSRPLGEATGFAGAVYAGIAADRPVTLAEARQAAETGGEQLQTYAQERVRSPESTTQEVARYLGIGAPVPGTTAGPEIGSLRTWNGQTFQVVAVSAYGDPVYRRVGDPSPAERLAAAEMQRSTAGLGPSGGSLLRYLDSLAMSTGSVPGFGGAERANEVARFIAAMPANQQIIVDDTGTPRQTQALFQTSVWFSEQAYRAWEQAGFPTTGEGRPEGMTRIATEAIWDVIAARNKWGITGAEFLASQGYTHRGGGIWEWIPAPKISGYGGGSFSSGAGAGTPGFGGFLPSGPRREPLGLVNWRI